MTRPDVPMPRPALILALALLVVAAHGGGSAAAKAGTGCTAGRSLAGFVVCNDPALADDDRWMGQLMKERLAMADKAAAGALRQDQRAFLKEREGCMPPPPKPEPAAADQAAPAEGPATDIGAKPPDGAAGQPNPAAPDTAPPDTAPAAAAPPAAATPADTPRTVKLADAPPDAAPAPSDAGAQPGDAQAGDAQSAGDQPTEQQILACLRGAYHARIDALEAPLRHAADISLDAPGAPSICAAVSQLESAGKSRLLSRHAVPVTEIDDADEMHPTVKLAHLRRYMSPAAWQAAAEAAEWWNGGMGSVSVAKAGLFPGKPPIWIFSTVGGEGNDRNLFLFEATADGTMADRLIGRLGGEGAGAFDTLFVRFKTGLFAIEKPTGTDAGQEPQIYALDQSQPVCTFAPPPPEPGAEGATGQAGRS